MKKQEYAKANKEWLQEKAKEEGVRVYCETCPQYLFLTEEKYHLPGFEGAKYVCSPPLRSSANASAACRTPHTAMRPFGGFRSPCVEYIDSTNVAEFAEVMKKVLISPTITTDIAIPSG